MRALITGGSGFIGSNFINYVLRNNEVDFVLNVDRLDYGVASARNVDAFPADRYAFSCSDICCPKTLICLIRMHRIDTVVHFAAQSHVDTSFDNVFQHLRDNVKGTCSVLEAVRQCSGLVQRMVHISTDEVYGESQHSDVAPKTHESLLQPTNPYAASKAAAEMYVQAYRKSYNVPVIVTRGNNVFGPRQFPDKLIPRCIERIANGEACTVHGDGSNVRAFVYVADVCRAVLTILRHGQLDQIYNIHSPEERTVLDVIEAIGRVMGKPPVLEFVQDRPFNDARYFVDGAKFEALGWRPTTDFDDGLRACVDWHYAGSSSQ